MRPRQKLVFTIAVLFIFLIELTSFALIYRLPFLGTAQTARFLARHTVCLVRLFRELRHSQLNRFVNKRVQLKCFHQSALFTLQSNAAISACTTSGLPACLPARPRPLVDLFSFSISNKRFKAARNFPLARLGWNFQAHKDLSSFCTAGRGGRVWWAGRGCNRCAMRPM